MQSRQEVFSLARQELDRGQRILEELYPGSVVRQDGGPRQPDLIVQSHLTFYYDMKYRPDAHSDIALEYGSLGDDGRWFPGWIFTHPDWNLLYLLGDGNWYAWNSRELLDVLKSHRIPLTSHFGSRQGNVNYTTFCFGVRPTTLRRMLPSFVAKTLEASR